MSSKAKKSEDTDRIAWSRVSSGPYWRGSFRGRPVARVTGSRGRWRWSYRSPNSTSAASGAPRPTLRQARQEAERLHERFLQLGEKSTPNNARHGHGSLLRSKADGGTEHTRARATERPRPLPEAGQCEGEDSASTAPSGGGESTRQSPQLSLLATLILASTSTEGQAK